MYQTALYYSVPVHKLKPVSLCKVKQKAYRIK